jgi:hypothetical protein
MFHSLGKRNIGTSRPRFHGDSASTGAPIIPRRAATPGADDPVQKYTDSSTDSDRQTGYDGGLQEVRPLQGWKKLLSPVHFSIVVRSWELRVSVATLAIGYELLLNRTPSLFVLRAQSAKHAHCWLIPEMSEKDLLPSSKSSGIFLGRKNPSRSRTDSGELRYHPKS